MSLKSASRRVSLPLFPVILVVLVMAVVPAAAEDRPFHVEADVGRVSINDFDGFAIDESTTGFRLGTGYRFLPWLGVEGAYVDLGTVSASVDIGTGTPVLAEASADGFEVTLSGHVPLSDAFWLTAQAGVLWWTGDSSVGGSASSDSGNDVTWGVGAEYAFGPAFAVTAGWRRYKVEDVDADGAWLGLMVRFGDAQ